MNRPLSPKRIATNGIALWLALYFPFAAPVATVSGQARPATQSELEKSGGVGDSPVDGRPIATDLSPQLTHRDIGKAIRKVGDWQLERARPYFSQDWTFAALYAGYMAVPDAVAGDRYAAAMKAMGEKFDWQLGPRPFHADDQAIGQTYLDLYARYHDPKMLAPTRARMDAMLAASNPESDPDHAGQPLWWWCDALFMAPPVLAKLAKVTGDEKYLEFMGPQWTVTSGKLYDPREHLYFRDASFLNKREKNGRPVFWSRGNGWVMAGLVRYLQTMPREDRRTDSRYFIQFREMAAALAAVQGKDGLWRPGLLDPDSYALPEVSGSAFITYAYAFGINEGILPRSEYLPRVKRAWAGLVSHIYADGRLGSMQPIGAAPGEFKATSSYVFGVGAFLLAGSQVYRLAGK